MGKSVSEMVFEATTNRLCANIQALAPKLAYESRNSAHGRGECAQDAADGLRQLAELMTDYFAAVASDRADQTGAIFSSRYFRDCIGDVFSEAIGDFAAYADAALHSDEDVEA